MACLFIVYLLGCELKFSCILSQNDELWVEGWVWVPFGWTFVSVRHWGASILAMRLISQQGVPQSMSLMLESPYPCLYILKGSIPTTHSPSLSIAQARQTNLHVMCFACEYIFCLLFHWGCRSSRFPMLYRGFISTLKKTQKTCLLSPFIH